jgi:hypothetical protein
MTAKLAASEIKLADVLFATFLEGVSDEGGSPLTMKECDKTAFLKNQNFKMLIKSEPVAGTYQYKELMVIVQERCVHLPTCPPACLPTCMFDVILM